MFFWRQFSHALLLVRPLEVMKISHNRVRAWDLVWRSWFLHRPVRSKDMASCKKSRLTRWKTTRWTEWTACYLTWMTWSLECFFLSKFFTSMFSYWHFDEDMTRKLMWSRTRRKRNCRNKALIARALLKLGQAWHGGMVHKILRINENWMVQTLPILPLFRCPWKSRHKTQRFKAYQWSETMTKIQLAECRFRWLNETLYTITGSEALELFSKDPSLADAYHQARLKRLNML